MFGHPTGDLEHAAGVHSVNIGEVLGELLGEENPGLAAEWSATSGHWFPPWESLYKFMTENDDLFP